MFKIFENIVNNFEVYNTKTNEVVECFHTKKQAQARARKLNLIESGEVKIYGKN